ncbi:MAG: hypothetical protein RBR05_02650 [Candidatus Methanomethylophilaceae archaeon]|nr:hypothetical protein [Candidatus Methanomethylophilaceae archaeon]MDD3379276.1 hypothetical protein [Candidatus Methanomethylophilaceae archaeon]MDY0224286.1 hypothetical protein [Candidatus Methanomethylophilaceae archaeon]
MGLFNRSAKPETIEKNIDSETPIVTSAPESTINTGAINITRIDYETGYYLGPVDEQGIEHGMGTVYDLKDKLSYQGPFVHGKRTGRCRMYADGKLTYEGMCINGCMCGRGKLHFDKYVLMGDFITDGICNRGKIRYNDGSCYIGTLENGLKNGIGREYDAQGNLIFEGKYCNGSRVKE